jgi:hypothetical protein
MFFWIIVIILPISSAVVGITQIQSGTAVDLVAITIIPIVTLVIFVPLALAIFYLAKKICERRRWGILLSALIQGVLTLIVLIVTFQTGVVAHPGLVTSGVVGLLITIALFLVALRPVPTST